MSLSIPARKGGFESPRKCDLSKQIKPILPVQPWLQKYFAFPVGQIISTDSPIPSHTEGRIAIVTDAGCGGRGSVLRAMGSQGGFLGTCERSPASGREMLQRTAKSCGPDTPTLVS